jgi:hypothetical protein
MGLGTGDILNIGAGISSFLGGRSNAKAQKEQSRRQAQLLDMHEGAMGANLARLAGQGQQEYGQFRRGLAINAGQEQERRLAALQNLISQGFGQGSQAAAGYGQQAGMYGQQANQNYSDLGSLFQNYQYKNQLADLVKKRKELKWWDEDPVFGE